MVVVSFNPSCFLAPYRYSLCCGLLQNVIYRNILRINKLSACTSTFCIHGKVALHPDSVQYAVFGQIPNLRQNSFRAVCCFFVEHQRCTSTTPLSCSLMITSHIGSFSWHASQTADLSQFFNTAAIVSFPDEEQNGHLNTEKQNLKQRCQIDGNCGAIFAMLAHIENKLAKPYPGASC